MAAINIQKKAQLTGHNASIFALAETPNPHYFLSASGEGWVVRWDLQQPELGKLIAKVDTQIFSLLNLSDLNQLVIGNMNGGVHWVDLLDSNKTKNIAHHQKGVFGMIRTGKSVFTIGGEGKLTRWLTQEGRTVESFHLSNQSLRSIDFCERRNELAIGASDHAIYLVDATTMELKRAIPNAHENSVFTVKYSPDGQYLLSGGRDAHLKIWQISFDFRLISNQPAHWFTINDLVFHPSERWFATASRDKTIKIWDAQTFELLKVLDTIRSGCHINSVNRLLWMDQNLISCSDDRSIIVWEIE